jgi:hypothetical protein
LVDPGALARQWMLRCRVAPFFSRSGHAAPWSDMRALHRRDDLLQCSASACNNAFTTLHENVYVCAAARV